jgi:predicted small lipoprotein YifL
MKKLIYSLFLLAMTAMTFTGCEDVPAPYTMPTDSDSTHETPINPSGTGTQDDPFNVAAALNYITAGQGLDQTVYVKGVITGTPSIDTSYGNATYNLSDDAEATNQLKVFRGYYLGSQKFTDEDQIQEGDTVVVYGKITNYNGTYEFAQGNYIYSLNGKTGDSGNTDEPSGEGTETSPYNVAKTKAIFNSGTLPTDNVYIRGIVAKTGTVDSKYGSMTYYISDDGQSSNDLEIYHGLYLKGDKFTSDDQLAVGDTVVVLGQLFVYSTTQEIKNSQLVSIFSHDSGGETDENSITVNATDMGFTDKGTADNFTLSDGTTLTFDQGKGTIKPTYYAGSYAAIRMYANNTLTITSTNKKIVKISITTTDGYNGTLYNGNDEAYAMSGDTKVTVSKPSNNVQAVFDGLNASTITIVNAFTGTGGGVQLRIKSITITYAK